MLVKCPECGKSVSEQAANCPNCGYTFEKKKFCKFCGEKISFESVICPKCGKQNESVGIQGAGVVINNVANASATPNVSTPIVLGNEKNKVTALLLCIFLGWAGVHRFYEGRIGTGLLYLFTFGLFGIGWVVDIIAIASKPNPYYV